MKRAGRQLHPSRGLICDALRASPLSCMHSVDRDPSPQPPGSRRFVRLRRSSWPWAAADVVCAVATSDVLRLARREARTIGRVRKAAPPRALPPDVGARKTRRRYSADYVLRGSPTQRRHRGLQKTKDGRKEDYGFRRPRPPAPQKRVDVLIDIAGWRRWVGLRSRPTSGGTSPCAARTFVRRAHPSKSTNRR